MNHQMGLNKETQENTVHHEKTTVHHEKNTVHQEKNDQKDHQRD